MENTIISYDPSNGEVVGNVRTTSINELPAVVARAHKARNLWQKLTIDERVTILQKAYANAAPHVESLAELLSREMGKDIGRSFGEVSGSIQGGSYNAPSVAKALAPRNTAGNTWVEHKPLGVAAIISPWNYPLAMANNLLVPALIAGNTVIFKPSEETPLIADKFVSYLNEVLPEGVLNIVHGDRELGKAIVESDVQLIAFTGSLAAGKDIMKRAAGDIKRLIMELGGNDPMIVLEDANLEAAARFAVASSFENSGQMCTSTERIYVHESIADTFEKRVSAIASQYTVGPWHQDEVNIGPIINKQQHTKIIQHIADAESKGARVLLGGSSQPERYITPTVIAGMTPDMIMEQEETFGPVVAISTFSTVEEAIERANDSVYGLGAVVYGKNDAQRVANAMEAGMIGVNQGVGGMGDAPWVGAKQSGLGYHGSSEGHRLFTQTCVVNR